MSPSIINGETFTFSELGRDLWSADQCTMRSAKPRATPCADERARIDACVARVRAGDGEAAAEELVEHLYPTVAKVLHRRLPQQLAIDDVAQQVFLKVFSKLHQYRGKVPIEHWVSKIAVKTCLNAMRGLRMRHEIRRADLSEAEDALLDDRISDLQPGIDAAVAARDLLEKLLECLNPRERLAVELTELEGYTSTEAAKLLGSNSVAVRVRVSRARAKMRSHWESLQSEEEFKE